MSHEEGPDPRFILANERTFLSWIRTCLGLIAGGVALAELWKGEHDGILVAVAVLPVIGGLAISVLALWRWRAGFVALHEGRSLPEPHLLIALTILIAVVGFALVSILVFG